MGEKIRLYVDSNEKGFIDDCYLADNTKIICEFYHEESEIEYSNCKLLNLQEYDKQKDQRIAELEKDLEFTTKTANELIAIKHKLEHQLEEKDKEIERLKVFEKAYYFNQTQVSQESMDLLLQNAYQVHNETQLAIQELEKVKEEMDLNGNSYCEIRQGTSPHNPTDYAWFNYVKFRNYLNQQIEELKGE